MKKIYFLWGLLLVLSLLFGYFLGRLDFFGFLDGRHEVNFIFLLGALITSYFLTLIVIFIDLVKNKSEYIFYGIGSLLFTGVFALVNGNILAALAAGLLFIGFLWIVAHHARRRLEMFVHFYPNEVFFPILKRGFLFVVGMFAVINFFQSQIRLENNTLISPGLVKTISKPFIVVFNKQLEKQLKDELGNQSGSTDNTAARKQIVEFVLVQTIQSTLNADGKGIGIKPNDIPADKAIVYQNGGIDITPVIHDMTDEIALALNIRLQPYIFIAPFIVALATIIIFQPLMWPIELVENFISKLIFFILLRSGFIKSKKETREVERISI